MDESARIHSIPELTATAFTAERAPPEEPVAPERVAEGKMAEDDRQTESDGERRAEADDGTPYSVDDIVSDGCFLEAVEAAAGDPGEAYVLVIEEINRGNPAQIFGEMLTLLEADKRIPTEAIALSYPRHSAERVHIPPNLYVIGTMNVADRSLALVDFALRRRFAFVDLEPTLGDTWRTWVSEQCGIEEAFLRDIESRLNELNAAIADDAVLGAHFRVGHSVVTPPPGVEIPDPQQWFRQVVETEITPLLGEYWFDDPKRAESAGEKLLLGLTP